MYRDLIQSAERPPRRPFQTGLRRGGSRFNSSSAATTTRSGAIPASSATVQASRLLRQHPQLEPVLDMDTSSLAFANNYGTSNPTRSININERSAVAIPPGESQWTLTVFIGHGSRNLINGEEISHHFGTQQREII
jgi:hypothetical protein